MNKIYILILGILFISACTQNNQDVKEFQDDLSIPQTSIEQPKETNKSLKTLTPEKENKISVLESKISSSIILSKNEKNIVNIGDELIITNLMKYGGKDDQIIVSISNVFYEIIEYGDMEIGEDNTSNVTLPAPQIPGNYQVVLVEYPDRITTHTYFDLTVLGKTETEEQAIQIVKQAVRADFINITDVSLLNNKWHINLTADYSFGCCSGCAPGEVCIAMCVSCGTKTMEGYYIISDEGLIEQETIKEIACKGSSNWFRNITGDELCSIDWDNLD